MLIIGHRGASSLAPENSMEAMRAGFEAGADMLELDVRLTKDNIPVVIHDWRLKRTHNENIGVAQLTFEQLQERTKNQPVPSLRQILDEFFGIVLLNIEFKSRGVGNVVAQLIADEYVKDDDDWDNVIFSSFKASELSSARKVSPLASLALLHNRNPFIFIAYHRQLKLTAVGFHRLYINPFALEIAKRAGLFTYAYTVNRPHTAFILSEQGIDGIVTDNPDKILKEIKKKSA